MRIWTSCTVAILFSTCAAFAAPAPQAPNQQLQQFVVLQSERLVAPFESLTSEQAECAISGTSNFATMRCLAPAGTAKASYHYITALVVDKEGKAYGIVCHESLVNLWCKKFTPGTAIQGSFASGEKVLSVADGQRFHPYQTLTSANVGPLPATQPAPSAKAAKPGAEPSTPAAAVSPSASSPAGSQSKAQGNASSSSPAPSLSEASGQTSGASSGAAPGTTSGIASSQSSGNCATPVAACVAFVSEPPGADIYVDGKFVGSTPSSLALPAGSHEIRVEADQFKPWTRTLTSTAGSTVTIHAALEKK